MKKPNILWICTDQQRADSLGCYGNTWIETPNLDSLARSGVRFQNAYCQSPVCAPSRGSFLTGRYPRTCRLRQNGQRLPGEEKLVTSYLKDAGYVCGLSGKLHLAPCDPGMFPGIEERGDDGYSVFHWSHHPNPDWPVNAYSLWLGEKGMTYRTRPFEKSGYVEIGMPTEYHHTTFCIEKAETFIRNQEGFPNPWLYSVNLFDPHHSFDPPDDLFKKYCSKPSKDRQVSGQMQEKAEDEAKITFQRLDHKGAYNQKGHFPYDEMTAEDHFYIKAAYAAMIELIDFNIGRLMNALKETGQLENTIVIFMSDHGEMLGDHGLYLKGPYFYEELVKVPLLISCPGKIRENYVSYALTELVDLSPTLLDFAGTEVETGMQGKSMKKLLEGGDVQDRIHDAVYCEYYNAMPWHTQPAAHATMVRSSRYKLVRYHSTREGELYDLKLDPEEKQNLWEDECHKEVKIEMLLCLADKMAWTADPLPFRKSAW